MTTDWYQLLGVDDPADVAAPPPTYYPPAQQQQSYSGGTDWYSALGVSNPEPQAPSAYDQMTTGYNPYSGPWQQQYMPDNPPPQSYDPVAAQQRQHDWYADLGVGGYNPYDQMVSGQDQYQQPAATQVAPQAQRQLAPWEMVGDWVGNTWDAFAAPFNQPTKQGMNPFEWVGDNINKGAEAVTGAMGEAFKPAGGLVDNLADSGIPGISQYAGTYRNIWEQAVEPAANAWMGTIGEAAHGANQFVGDAWSDLTNGKAGNIGGDLVKDWQQSMVRQPLVQLAYEALNPWAKQNMDTYAQQQAALQYSQLLAQGVPQDEAMRQAGRTGTKLMNPVTQAEQASMQDFSQLPIAEQLFLQFTEANPANAIFARGLDPAMVPLRAGANLAGKGVGAAARGLADVTGTAPAFERLGQAIEGPQKFLAGTKRDLEVTRNLLTTAEQSLGDSGLAQQAVFLDPTSDFYWEKQGIRKDIAEEAAQWLGVIDKHAQLEAGVMEDNAPQQTVLPQNESDMARRAQDTSPGAALTLADEGKPEPGNNYSPLPPEPSRAVQRQLGEAYQAEAARVEEANPGSKVQFDEQQNPVLVRPDGQTTPLDDPALKEAFTNFRDVDSQVKTRPASIKEQIGYALDDYREQRISELKTEKPSADPSEVMRQAEAEADAFRAQIKTPEDLKAFKDEHLPAPEVPFDTGVPQPSIDATFSKRIAPPEVRAEDITDIHRAAGIPGLKPTHGELLGAVEKTLGAKRKAYVLTEKSTQKNPKLRETRPLEQFGKAGDLLNKFGNLTMPYMGRAFLNKSGRAFRDNAGNILKYVAEGFGRSGDTIPRFERVRKQAGIERPGETLPLGKSSVLADIGGKESRGGFAKELLFHVLNPFDELSGDILRAVTKGKFKDWNDFTEKAEMSLKTYAYKREFLKNWDEAIDRRVRSKSLAPEIGKLLKEGKLDETTASSFIAHRMPEGASLEAIKKGTYNPQNYSAELQTKLAGMFKGEAGPIGKVVKEGLDSLPDRIERENKKYREAFEKAIEPLKKADPKGYMDSERYKTIKANLKIERPIHIEDIDPTHFLWKEMKQDIYKQLDVQYKAAQIQESMDPAIRLAVRNQIVLSLDWAARQKNVEGLKKFAGDKISSREASGYYDKYNRAAPTKTEPATQRSGYTQRFPNNVEKMKLQKDILAYGKTSGHGTAADVAIKQLRNPDPAKVIFKSERADGPHYRVDTPENIGKNGQAETQVWPIKEDTLEPTPAGTPATPRDRILTELKATGYNETHAKAGMALLDAFADAYEQRTGRSKNDVYDRIKFSNSENVTADALKQTANVRRGLEPEIPGARNAANIERSRAAMRDWTDAKYGPAEGDEAQITRFLDFATDEIDYQRGLTSGSGSEWYTDDWRQALDRLKDVFPEMKTDVQAERLFKVFAGLTSQNTPVLQNITKAINAFEMYGREGKIPLTKLNGTKYGLENPNLEKFQRLVTEHFGDNIGAAVDWLSAKHTHSEIAEKMTVVQNPKTRATNLKDIADDIDADRELHRGLGDVPGNYTGKAYGSVVFGPKIGNFVANLFGAPDRTTKDLWFTTTWNRYMGKLGEEVFKDQPTDHQRKIMDQAMVELVKRYRDERGITITMPEAQALLWYYEKQLEDFHGLNKSSDSYGSAIGEGIAKARAEGLVPGRPTPPSYRRVTTEDTGSVQPAGVRGGAEASRSFSQEAGRQTLGATEINGAGNYIVKLFKNANASTMPHELAHVFRQMLDGELLKTSEEFVGAKDGIWDVAHEEKFARGFENYLRSGKAPTETLKAVFEQFKAWLHNIYKVIKGGDIDVTLTPEIKNVFKQMLGGDPDKIVPREAKAPRVKPAEAEAKPIEPGDTDLWAEPKAEEAVKPLDLGDTSDIVERAKQERMDEALNGRKPVETPVAAATTTTFKAARSTPVKDIRYPDGVVVRDGQAIRTVQYKGGSDTGFEVFTPYTGRIENANDLPGDTVRKWRVRDTATGEVLPGAYRNNTQLTNAVKDAIRGKKPTVLKQEAAEHTPEELAGYEREINAPPGVRMDVDTKQGQVVSPQTLRTYATNWNRGRKYGEPTTGQLSKEQKLQYWRDIVATDEHIRSTTGNTFKLDLNNFTPVRISDGKSLDELVGRKRLSDIGEPTPQWPTGDPPNDVQGVIKEVEDYFGGDARKAFAKIKEDDGEAGLNMAYAAIAKRLKFPDPTDPATPTNKTGWESKYARKAVDALEADARDRYIKAASQRSANNATDMAQAETRDSLTSHLNSERAKALTEADQASYKRIEGTYFDYQNKNVIDQMLGSMLPFNYWARRNFAYVARYFSSHPVQFAAILQFYNNVEEENKKAGNIASYNMGNLLLWTNPDGSKVQWNFSSMMPFNPLGNSDSMMQLIDATDGENDDSTSNKTPLAMLFGYDTSYKGKVTGRQKGLVPTFLSPNPLIDILLKTGVPNDLAKKLGIVTDGFFSPDPSDKRAERQTTGLVGGRTAVRDIFSRLGITDFIRQEAQKAGIKFTDLDLEGPLNELIFGANSGKPLTAVMQELTEAAQGDPKHQEKYLTALAKLKEGNWTPEALKALDTVNSQSAWQRAASMAGFVSVVNNTPRQQLSNNLSAGYGAVAGDKGHYEVTKTDPKTGYQTRKFVPGASQDFFDKNAGASVAFAKNKTADQINESIGDTKTSKALTDLNKAYYDDKKITLRQFNKGLDDLKAGNPSFFKASKDKDYQQAKGELPDLPGAAKQSVSDVDTKYAKQEPGTERAYAEWKDDLFRAGGDRYQELSDKISAAYDSGNKKAAYPILDSAEYKQLKAARQRVLDSNPDFANRKKAEDEAKYGPTTTGTGSSGGTGKTSTYTPYKTTYKASSYTPYKSTGSKSSGTASDWTAQQKSLYGQLRGKGYSAAAATSVVNKQAATGTAQQKSGVASTGATTAAGKGLRYDTYVAPAFRHKAPKDAPSVANSAMEKQGWDSEWGPGDFGGDATKSVWTSKAEAQDAVDKFTDGRDDVVGVIVWTPENDGYSVYFKSKDELTEADQQLLAKTTIAKANSSGYSGGKAQTYYKLRTIGGGGGGGGGSRKSSSTYVHPLGAPYKVPSAHSGALNRFSKARKF